MAAVHKIGGVPPSFSCPLFSFEEPGDFGKTRTESCVNAWASKLTSGFDYVIAVTTSLSQSEITRLSFFLARLWPARLVFVHKKFEFPQTITIN